MIAINMQALIIAIREALSDCSDLNLREFADKGGNRFTCISIDNLSDRGYVSGSVILPVINNASAKTVPERVSSAEVRSVTDADEAVAALLDGNAVVISESENAAYSVSVRSEEFRGIENAGTEEVVRGPHDSFIEDAATNVALVRRRLRTPKLKCISTRAGKLSHTKIFIMYVEGIADAAVVSELIKRIESCELETLHDSGTLEMAILDGKFSIFPVIANTERPDKAAAKLSEGRAAVFVDGSPVVLTVPELYIETLQSADDYSKSPQYATFARCLRFTAVMCSLLLPAVYLSMLEYHQTMIPKRLLETLAAQRQNVPYSVFAELFVMLAVFDVIREVGQRMPRAMGSVVSIVAGIVLGDAAMTAGLVGAPTLMVVAFSATCAYISPPVTWTNILLKFPFVILAQIGGLVGVALGFFALCTFLAGKCSFGVPYLSPVAPFVKSGIKDTLIKFKGGVQS